jgi:acyl carrier protein
MYTSEFSDILEQVQSILADQLCLAPNVVAPSARLAEDLDMDRLDFAKVCIALEETFDVEIDEAREFRTIFDIAAFLSKRVPPSAGYAMQPAPPIALSGTAHPWHSNLAASRYLCAALRTLTVQALAGMTDAIVKAPMRGDESRAWAEV